MQISKDCFIVNTRTDVTSSARKPFCLIGTNIEQTHSVFMYFHVVMLQTSHMSSGASTHQHYFACDPHTWPYVATSVASFVCSAYRGGESAIDTARTEFLLLGAPNNSSVANYPLPVRTMCPWHSTHDAGQSISHHRLHK